MPYTLTWNSAVAARACYIAAAWATLDSATRSIRLRGVTGRRDLARQRYSLQHCGSSGCIAVARHGGRRTMRCWRGGGVRAT